MKPARSMTGRITLMMLMFGVVMIVVNHWWTRTWMTERHLERLRAEAAEAASPLSGIMQHLLRRKQERAAELEMSYAALSPRVDLGLVCDRNGKVRFSTQLQWRGLNILQTPLAKDWPQIRKVLDAERSIDVWGADQQSLVVASRFYEGYDAASKGAVVMRYDYTHELEQLRSDSVHDFLAHVGVLGALCLLLWQALDTLFLQRVAKLLECFRGASSKGGTPATLDGSDELALISQEFADTVKQLREAENMLLEAAEEERRRVGRELHDDLCQRITATKLKAEVVHELVPPERQQESELTRQLAEELTESAVIARSIARGLSPVGLEQDGLADALEDVALFVRKSYGVRCTVECDRVDRLLTDNAQELLFRIAQELVVNASKHSKPASISIEVKVLPDHVSLEVAHDGRPFEEAPAGSGNKGMGLHLMKQRLLTLNARLQRQVRAGTPEISIAAVHIPPNRANNPATTSPPP